MVRAQVLVMERAKPLPPDSGGVGFEVVHGDALRREALLRQHLAQQSACRSCAASRLDQEIEHFAFVIDRPPEPVSSIADLNDHLVEMPAHTGTRTATTKVAPDEPTEFQEPAPYHLVRHIDAALRASRSSTSRNQSVNRA